MTPHGELIEHQQRTFPVDANATDVEVRDGFARVERAGNHLHELVRRDTITVGGSANDHVTIRFVTDNDLVDLLHAQPQYCTKMRKAIPQKSG